MPTTILLVGPPSCATVEATFKSLRLQKTEPQVLRPASSPGVELACHGEENTKHIPSTASTDDSFPRNRDAQSSSNFGPRWRMLDPEERCLATGLTQRDWLAYTPLGWPPGGTVASTVKSSSDTKTASTSFDTVLDEDLQGVHCEDDGEAAFLEKSFALHDDAEDAAMTPATSFCKGFEKGTGSLTPITESSESDLDALPSSPLAPKSAKKARLVTSDPGMGFLCLPKEPPLPIKHLPTAFDIMQAYPATLTANLVAGIAKINPQRTVTMRRNGRLVSLIDVIVADETTSRGFGVSFWLGDTERSKAQNNRGKSSLKHELEKELGDVEVGDVVLITNIGLSQWRGKVHGTSLARRNWRTEVSKVGRRSTHVRALGRKGWSNGALEIAWQSRAQAVKAFVEASIAPADVSNDVGHPLELIKASTAAKARKRKWLPEDDTQER